MPRRLLRICTALVAVFLTASCQRHKPSATPPPAAAPGPGLPPELAGALPRLPSAEETRPVYPPKLTFAPAPLAVAFCQAIHTLPEQRRAACCQSSPGIVITDECVRVLSWASRDGAVTLDGAALERCRHDQEEALAGCDWVGPWQPELPASCQQVLTGTLPRGRRCRSSLECVAGLQCGGVGPTQLGTCEPPRPDGEPCAQAVDPLAAYTRGERLMAGHPECAGFCNGRHRCEQRRPVGAECRLSGECAADGRCADGRCVAGAIAEPGGACGGGDCPPGLRCHQHRCQAPGASGAACASDFDCRGGCTLPPGVEPTVSSTPHAAKPGACAPKCSVR